jgi:hypothetical protein
MNASVGIRRANSSRILPFEESSNIRTSISFIEIRPIPTRAAYWNPGGGSAIMEMRSKPAVASRKGSDRPPDLKDLIDDGGPPKAHRSKPVLDDPCD